MTYTFDKSSGTDFTLTTSVGSGTDTTTIYANNGSDALLTLSFSGYRFLRNSPANWGNTTAGTNSDTLVATDDNDFIFWDYATTSGLASGGNTNNQAANTGTRQRLYNSNDSQNRDFEVFDLRGGHDILNLTHLSGSGSPGDFDGSVTVYGGSGNDTLALSDGSDYVYGGTGNDVIYGGGGLDRLWGDNGSTNINETSGGHDTIYGGGGSNATIWGEGGNDYLVGSGEGVETFYGGAGNDTIHNWSGFGDVAYGGAGDDRIITADTAYGGTGNDWIDGGFGGTGVEGRDLLYGDEGDDTVYGYDANDTLYGGPGLDTLYGGTEDDELHFHSDAVTNGGVRLWTGETADPTVTLSLSNYTYTNDTFFGDAGTDTLVLDDGDNVFTNSPGDIRTGQNFSNAGGVTRMYGIEIVLAGAGADIIGLNHRSTGTGGDSTSIYSQNITIAGEDGADIIMSGSGNDLLIGGRLNNGVSHGADTIYGGAGNDTIYGDSRTSNGGTEGVGDDVLYGGSGDDTIYGGAGHDTIYGGSGNDLLFGGAGNDLIFDTGSSNAVMSHEGDDTIVLNLNSPSLIKAHSITGLDNASDGADRVFVTGSYASVSFSLGAGDDLFIAIPNDAGNGSLTDRVLGQSGDDVISTWHGNDYLDGGADNDALWGGAGGDTIYGGPGSDFLYGGPGNNDMLFGGTGVDYYYWARTDGQGDQIFDEYRGTSNVGQAENGLLVFAGYDSAGNLPPGMGVFEVDGNITDNVGGDDMVRAYDLDGAGPGTLWRLEILQGAGAGNYVEFDQRDISAIGLWNHDAGPGQQVITVYEWDGSTYSLV